MDHWGRIGAAISGAAPDRVPVALWKHFPGDDQDAGKLAARTLEWQRTWDFDLVKFMPSGTYGVEDWGAISKTNGIGLRWRDPIYRSVRELAMSYFHEYYNRWDRKTLRTYSRPFDLRRMKTEKWVTPEEGAWDMIDTLEALRHYKLLGRGAERHLTRRDPFERVVGNLLQYRRPRKAGARAKAARRKK